MTLSEGGSVTAWPSTFLGRSPGAGRQSGRWSHMWLPVFLWVRLVLLVIDAFSGPFQPANSCL